MISVNHTVFILYSLVKILVLEAAVEFLALPTVSKHNYVVEMLIY